MQRGLPSLLSGSCRDPILHCPMHFQHGVPTERRRRKRYIIAIICIYINISRSPVAVLRSSPLSSMGPDFCFLKIGRESTQELLRALAQFVSIFRMQIPKQNDNPMLGGSFDSIQTYSPPLS